MKINRQLWMVGLFNLLVFTPQVMALTDQQKKMLKQLDQLDQLDHLDFVELNEKANTCIFARDFSCAEEKIAKAAKSISNPQDRNELRITQQNLSKERQLKADEERAERERVLAEERRKVEAERQRIAMEERAEEKRQHDANVKGAFAILAGTAVGYSARNYSPEQQKRLIESAERSVMTGNTSEFDATSNQVLGERQQQHNAQMQEIAEQKRRAAEAKQQREQREREQQEHEREQRERQQQVDEKSRQARPVQVAAANVYGSSGSTPTVIGTTVQGYNPAHVAQAPTQQQVANQRSSNQSSEAADRQATQNAKRQAEQDYLAALKQGIRLHATKCMDGEGHYYATGTMPKIKRELSCIDVHFKARCPGSAAYSSGVLDNFGVWGGCLGDLTKITPKPGCPVEQVVVEVTDVRPGCN